jgi:hypothetical protein
MDPEVAERGPPRTWDHPPTVETVEYEEEESDGTQELERYTTPDQFRERSSEDARSPRPNSQSVPDEIEEPEVAIKKPLSNLKSLKSSVVGVKGKKIMKLTKGVANEGDQSPAPFLTTRAQTFQSGAIPPLPRAPTFQSDNRGGQDYGQNRRSVEPSKLNIENTTSDSESDSRGPPLPQAPTFGSKTRRSVKLGELNNENTTSDSESDSRDPPLPRPPLPPPFGPKTQDYRPLPPPFGSKTQDYRPLTPPFRSKTQDYRPLTPPFGSETQDYPQQETTPPLPRAWTSRVQLSTPPSLPPASTFRMKSSRTKTQAYPRNETIPPLPRASTFQADDQDQDRGGSRLGKKMTSDSDSESLRHEPIRSKTQDYPRHENVLPLPRASTFQASDRGRFRKEFIPRAQGNARKKKKFSALRRMFRLDD